MSPLAKEVSGRARGRKPATIWTVVGYDENGTVIARIEGLTEKEANMRVLDYPRGTTVKAEVLGINVMCGVENCKSKAVTLVRPSSVKEAVPVCRYHASSVHIPPRSISKVKGKLKLKSVGMVVASDYLCVIYCPSYLKGECHAMRDPKDNKGLAAKLREGYRGMTILCVEDPWWKK